MQTTARDLKYVTAIEFSHEASLRELRDSGVSPEAELCRQIADYIEEHPQDGIISITFDNSHMPHRHEPDPTKRLLNLLFGDDPWIVTATLVHEPPRDDLS